MIIMNKKINWINNVVKFMKCYMIKLKLMKIQIL